MNPELKIPEFDGRNYATKADYPDEFGEVKVVDPVKAQQARGRDIGRISYADAIAADRYDALDDGARLDTPTARRQRTIDDMSANLEKAIDQGEKAKAWAQSIGLSNTVVSKLNRGLDALVEALAEIVQFESR